MWGEKVDGAKWKTEGRGQEWVGGMKGKEGEEEVGRKKASNQTLEPNMQFSLN